MQYLKPFLAVLGVTLFTGGLSACGDRRAAIGEGERAPVKRDRISYEIVTETRPASVGEYFKLARSVYDICVIGLDGAAARPFPAVKDFLVTRERFVSDGTKYFHRTDNNVIDTSRTSAEYGCEVTVRGENTISLISDGKRHFVSRNGDGEKSSDVSDAALVPRSNAMSLFTNARKVNGVALKCMPQTMDVDPSGTGICTVDPDSAGGVIGDAEGTPLVVHQVVPPMAPMKTELVTTPVSFNSGKQVDISAFQWPAAK